MIIVIFRTRSFLCGVCAFCHCCWVLVYWFHEDFSTATVPLHRPKQVFTVLENQSQYCMISFGNVCQNSDRESQWFNMMHVCVPILKQIMTYDKLPLKRYRTFQHLEVKQNLVSSVWLRGYVKLVGYITMLGSACQKTRVALPGCPGEQLASRRERRWSCKSPWFPWRLIL